MQSNTTVVLNNNKRKSKNPVLSIAGMSLEEIHDMIDFALKDYVSPLGLKVVSDDFKKRQAVEINNNTNMQQHQQQGFNRVTCQTTPQVKTIDLKTLNRFNSGQ
ncbi:hypothetical protein ABK040_015179 [Willaertia magna]